MNQQYIYKSLPILLACCSVIGSTVEVVIPDDLILKEMSQQTVQQSQEQQQQQQQQQVVQKSEVDNKNSSTSSTTGSTTTSQADLLLSTCRTFIAQSTIPGAGLGLFSGQQFKRGDQITTGDGVVPLIDTEWNSDVASFENQFLWDEYVWSAGTFSGMSEHGHQFEAASFGIGALPNCFFPLLNAHDSYADRDYGNVDQPGIDPGSGAFTVFHNRQGTAKKEIKPGDEIFVDYGYGYFEGDRQGPYGLIPFLDNYRRADQLLLDFRRVVKRLAYRNKPPVDDETLYDLVKDIILIWPSRTQGALPSFAKDIPYVLDVLGSTKYVHAHRSRRDLQWLYENGACLDHLVIKNSTIKHAGRGAFANKYIPAGSVIAPVPLIHIPDRNTLNVYDGYVYAPKGGTPEYTRNSSNLLHKQLMLNYCFGHRDSSILLCPYGVASSLVNHGGIGNANTKIVWSDKITTRPEYFNMSIEEFGYTYKSGLAFDYIATRDIQPGEEVLIDYGLEWQTAWEEHLATWTPRPLQTQLLNDADPPIELQLHTEWNLPGDIHLWCHDIYRTMQGLFEVEDDDQQLFHPCRVISKSIDKDSGEVLYIAELRLRDYGDTSRKSMNSGCVEIFDEILFDLPRDAFVFGTAIDYNGDDKYRLYKETWTFRHDIRIPDHLMPNAWKDLISNTSSL